MTNFAPDDPARDAHLRFRQYLADAGMTDLHGLEMLRLVRMVGGAYDMVMNEHLRAVNLSGPRWRVLFHLWLAEAREQAGINPTTLSHIQNVSKNTMSSHLRSLEEMGLIERRLDPADRRQFAIHLSAEGRGLVQEMTPAMVGLLNRLLADLTDAEVEQLQDLLAKLHSGLCRHGDLSCPPATDDAR